jgi:hypothetical protein
MGIFSKLSLAVKAPNAVTNYLEVGPAAAPDEQRVPGEGHARAPEDVG